MLSSSDTQDEPPEASRLLAMIEGDLLRIGENAIPASARLLLRDVARWFPDGLFSQHGYEVAETPSGNTADFSGQVRRGTDGVGILTGQDGSTPLHERLRAGATW